MATLVLTAVGAAVGGPLGAAVGAMAGQQIDARIFAPKARQGPRLGELAVQTSSYGSQIPKLFGTMRVAGTVICATDLKEKKSSSGGDQGQPNTVNYSYSASFAVALWDGRSAGCGGSGRTASSFGERPETPRAGPNTGSTSGVRTRRRTR